MNSRRLIQFPNHSTGNAETISFYRRAHQLTAPQKPTWAITAVGQQLQFSG
jgi:hypothetical protein